MFKAWTTQPQAAIEPQKNANFSFNVSTKGAILGHSPAKVLFQSGESVMVDNVWTSSKEPLSYVALVAATILAILLLHFAVIVRKNRRAKNNAA